MKFKTLLVSILGSIMILVLGATLYVNYRSSASLVRAGWQRQLDLTLGAFSNALAGWASLQIPDDELQAQIASALQDGAISDACLSVALRRAAGEPLFSWENPRLTAEVAELGLLRESKGGPSRASAAPQKAAKVDEAAAKDIGVATMAGPWMEIPAEPSALTPSSSRRPDPRKFQQLEIYVKSANYEPKGVAEIWISNVSMMKELRTLRTTYLLLLTGAALPILLLAWGLGRFISKPVEDVAQSMRQLTEGARDLFIDETGTTEIRELIRSFNILSAEMEEKQRMAQELDAARHVQAALIPQAAPLFSDWQVYGVSLPASEVGGDFYFHELYGRLYCGVGDVSGKGMPAALSVALSLGSLKALFGKTETLDGILRQLNQTLSYQIKEGLFLAMNMVELQPNAPVLKIVNAGQPYPLVHRSRQGRTQYVDILNNNLPLGILPDLLYETQTVELAPKDTLLLYSDGAVEMMNPRRDMIGFERFQAIVQETQTESLSEWSTAILHRVMFHTRGYPQHDDVTLLMARFNPQ